MIHAAIAEAIFQDYVRVFIAGLLLGLVVGVTAGWWFL